MQRQKQSAVARSMGRQAAEQELLLDGGEGGGVVQAVSVLGVGEFFEGVDGVAFAWGLAACSAAGDTGTFVDDCDAEDGFPGVVGDVHPVGHVPVSVEDFCGEGHPGFGVSFGVGSVLSFIGLHIVGDCSSEFEVRKVSHSRFGDDSFADGDGAGDAAEGDICVFEGGGCVGEGDFSFSELFQEQLQFGGHG